MNAPIGVFTSTPDDKLLSANSAMAGMFGYNSPEEMIDLITDIGRQLYADPEDLKEFILQLEKYSEVVNNEK